MSAFWYLKILVRLKVASQRTQLIFSGLDDPALGHLPKHCLPRPIVRGAMMARCNSLMRGHSAVRREVIGAMLNLLNLDFIPVVPLRGSISASGDLTPLSYIAGALVSAPVTTLYLAY